MEWKACFVAIVKRKKDPSILGKEKKRITMECCEDDYQSLSLDSADLVHLQSIRKLFHGSKE